MSRSWWFRTAFLIFLLLLSCVLLMPTVVEMVLYPESEEEVAEESADEVPRNPPLPKWYQDLPLWMKSKTLALGLDLQGGLMLRYSVDVDSAIDDKLASNASSIRSALVSDMTNPVAVSYRLDRNANEIHLTFENADDTKRISAKFLEDYPMLAISTVAGSTVTLGLSPNYFKDAEESSVKQAVEIIRERIDQLGVAQPNVRVESGRNIVVELPGLSRSRVAAAEKLISTTAVLTFKLVAPKTEAVPVVAALGKE